MGQHVPMQHLSRVIYLCARRHIGRNRLRTGEGAQHIYIRICQCDRRSEWERGSKHNDLNECFVQRNGDNDVDSYRIKFHVFCNNLL